MAIDVEYLHNMYNATSTEDGNGNIETYQNWLERQLIHRIEKEMDNRLETRNCLICGFFCANYHHAASWYDTKKS